MFCNIYYFFKEQGKSLQGGQHRIRYPILYTFVAKWQINCITYYKCLVHEICFIICSQVSSKNLPLHDSDRTDSLSYFQAIRCPGIDDKEID